jgi:hypothetical protein
MKFDILKFYQTLWTYCNFSWNRETLMGTLREDPRTCVSLRNMSVHSLMEPNSPWEAASCAATQQIPSILWNPKVHYRVHKSRPLVHILSQIDPDHTIPSYLRSILILSIHLCLALPSGLFPPGFPTNILYAFLFSPIRASCPAHLILLDLIEIWAYLAKYLTGENSKRFWRWCITLRITGVLGFVHRPVF